MEEQLLRLGFSEGEANTYLAALELGEASVANIAEKAGIERTTVYGFIEDLKKRGLITISKRGKKTVYRAENPKKLRNEVDERWKLLDGLLPELLSITNVIEQKPKVRFFDTREGIFDIYRETLEYPKSTIQMWMSARGMWYDDEKFWRDFYMPSRMEKKILMQAILPKNEKTLQFASEDNQSNRVTRLTDEQAITTDIVLYGLRSIAIISFDEMTALVIESDKLHQTFLAIFNAHWNSLQANEEAR